MYKLRFLLKQSVVPAFPAVLLLAGCVAPISVRETEPPPPPHGASQAAIAAFRKLSSDDPRAACGRLLDGIRVCQNRIGQGEESAIEDYNDLLGRFVRHLELAGVEPWGTTVALQGESTVYQLRGIDPRGFATGGREILPTNMLRFSGKYAVSERVLKPGVGAPVVVAEGGKVDFTDKLPDFISRYRSATALMRVEGNRATLELISPFDVERVSFAGRSRPLAMDYSSTISLAVSRDRIDKLGIARMLDPQRYANTARLNFTQPYDPRRIPVLFVHGLNDTPATWMPMYFGLIRDPEIREKYQFWTYSYPSGYPFPYSASLLRKELDRVRAKHPGHKDIVIVGHSMGGILSRMMVSNAGDSVWVALFGKPPSETKLTGASREVLEDALVFDARTEISRAVFICAPHRGSELASNWVGRLGARLVRAPALLADVSQAAIHLVTVDPAAMHLERAPNSVDTLSPRNRIVRATGDLPIDPSVSFHSLMGDRGKGNTPESSDGIVAYWSSHLDGAESEKIIPHHHGSHQHPEAAAEVARILKLHAGRDG